MAYFKETCIGVIELDWKFRLKSNYAALQEYNAGNECCFKVRDRITNLVEQHEENTIYQSLSSKKHYIFS